MTLESGTFDCIICCGSYKNVVRGVQQQVVCPGCETMVCRQCQFNFERDQCMNCGLQFTRDFVVENLGEKFLKEIVRPRITAELMKSEEELLPEAQEEVQKNRKLRAYKRNLRFGIVGELDLDVPVTTDPPKRHEIFRCPKDNCRGFIRSKYTCELCQSEVCSKCRVILPNSEESQHQCKKEDVTSLQLMAKETRPCPRCAVKIYKITGCDHMYCTHCCTHFSWRTGKVTNQSTNGHYLNLARYATDVATLNVNPINVDADGNIINANDNREVGTEDAECREYGFSLSENAVNPTSLSSRILTPNLEQSLYRDSNEIKSLFRSRLQGKDILQKSNENLKSLRVKYLDGTIDNKTWSDRVYLDYKKREQSLLYSEIFSLYLSTISFIQSRLLHVEHSVDSSISLTDEIVCSMEKLIELCNGSFHNVKREYGGKTYKIRQINEPISAPAFQTV